MKLYNTRDRNHVVDLREAVLRSLAPDGGLYMPTSIPLLQEGVLDEIVSAGTFADVAMLVASNLLRETGIENGELRGIVDRAFTFDTPVVMHTDEIGTCELWHGPSLAFKDFGARFMAELIGHFVKGADHKVTVLVATSGDTGGAVGAGFDGVDGIEVIILYPKGRVSKLQELQLTTLGDNIEALEIDGSFDDCQALVKRAFTDERLGEQYHLSSANSINIARLIPQSFYYFRLYSQVMDMLDDAELVVSVPSGNFGNLCAGVMAQVMGLPISRFIAATNTNDVVPHYIRTGRYEPRESVSTISNAMDVGAPSNFPRLQLLHSSTWNNMRDNITPYHLDDDATRSTMQEVYEQYGYICDPHGAIGYAALRDTLQQHELGIYLETAHPAKFKETVDETLGMDTDIPQSLADLIGKDSHKTSMSSTYTDLYDWLRDR
jgi:threonine synthase